jgi:hypothetical protein
MTPATPLRRLLGGIEYNHEFLLGAHWRRQPPEPLEWKQLPETEEYPDYDADVRVPADYEQPVPLRLQILFGPDPDGIYDLEWVATRDSRLAAGDPLVVAYRASDGHPFIQNAPFALTITKPLVVRNRRAIRGDALVEATVPTLAFAEEPIREIVRELQMELAQAVNAAIKGYMGAIGQSGQIVEHIVPVRVTLHPTEGYTSLIDQIANSLNGADLVDSDVVVISEKVISIAQARLFPLELLYECDPKTTDREGRKDLLLKAREYVPDVSLDDLLLSDSLLEWHDGPKATAGVRNPNRVAYEIARAIHERHGVLTDVVIADTDTGLDVREELINCITIGATPLGSTAGITIYECMRAANAAEFCRGSSRGIPIVICRPHLRCTRRNGIGAFRGYDGRLDADRERLLGYA